MNNITKKVEKTLREIAAMLPGKINLEQRVYTKVKGSELIKSNPKLKLNPNIEYKVPTKETCQVNHYRRLANAYKRGGWEAVEKYSNKNSLKTATK